MAEAKCWAWFIAVKHCEMYIDQPDNVTVDGSFTLSSVSAKTGVTRQPDNFSIAEHEKHFQSCKCAMCFCYTPLYGAGCENDILKNLTSEISQQIQETQNNNTFSGDNIVFLFVYTHK